MIQGFFSGLLADLHLIPFFSNFLVHISPRTVVIRWLSYVQLFRTPWIAGCQASLSFTISWSLLKLMSMESVISSNHLILCRCLLLLLSIFPSIRVFSKESALCISWPKYWSFSFNISHSNEHPRLISLRMHWLDLLAVDRKSTRLNSSHLN